MSFSLQCPNCGARPVAEFRWGGELRAGPPPELPAGEGFGEIYARRNVDGPQEEWWFHRLGCRRWFQARRDTRDNRVLAAWLPGTEVDEQSP